MNFKTDKVIDLWVALSDKGLLCFDWLQCYIFCVCEINTCQPYRLKKRGNAMIEKAFEELQIKGRFYV